MQPEQAAFNVGSAFSRGLTAREDRQAIDQILGQLGQGKGVSEQDLMSQVLQNVSGERQKPILDFLQGQQKQRTERDQLAARKKAQASLGLAEDLDPALAKEVYKAQQKKTRLQEIFGGSGDRGMGQETETAISPSQFGEESPSKTNLNTLNGQDRVEGIWENLNQEQKDRFSLEFPQESKILEDRIRNKQKLKQTAFNEERKYHTQFTKPIFEEADKLRSRLEMKDNALQFARNSVESGNLGFFSKDKLADITGQDVFRTAEGAQLINASKENLISNLQSVSAKAQNIWLEKRMNSMFPKIGQSMEANLTVAEMLEGESMMEKAYLKALDTIEEKENERFGFAKKDIKKRAIEESRPLKDTIMRRTSYRIKEQMENQKGKSALKRDVGKSVPKGTPLTFQMATMYKDKYGANRWHNKAKEDGYQIPTIEEFQMFQLTAPEFRERFL